MEESEIVYHTEQNRVLTVYKINNSSKYKIEIIGNDRTFNFINCDVLISMAEYRKMKINKLL